MKSVPKCVYGEDVGLIFHLMARHGDHFRFALFSCFNDLKLDNPITMATRMVSSNLFFMSFQKKISVPRPLVLEHKKKPGWISIGLKAKA